MAMVPVLFIAGVAFGYFVVLPRAVDFLQNFNDDRSTSSSRPRTTTSSRSLILLAMGLLFQIPVGRARRHAGSGSSRPSSCAKNRGYVILGLAVVAAVAAPTPDPVTMLIALAPLLVLFEVSIILAAHLRPAVGASRADPDRGDDDDGRRRRGRR